MLRLCFFLVVIFVGFPRVKAEDDDETDPHWDAYKEKYNKTYESPEDEAKARDNFEKNMLHAALHNLKDEHDYDKDVHEYSDMDVKEQIQVLCRTNVPDDETVNRDMEYFYVSERALPSSVDWNSAGKVSPVKNQGECGSCWTFSAAQAIESQYAISTNKMVPLSEQQLVDCAGDYGNSGCDGGWPQSAFDYVKDNSGLVPDTCYPYADEEGTCKDDLDCQYYPIRGYKNVGPAGDQHAVMKALADKGPLTAAIYVSDDLMYYSGGIFKDKTYKGQDVNHGVLLTGYGSENGKDYWIIKNSWGESWGEDGYFRLIRDGSNHLKIASYTSYPYL